MFSTFLPKQNVHILVNPGQPQKRKNLLARGAREENSTKTTLLTQKGCKKQRAKRAGNEKKRKKSGVENKFFLPGP